MESDLLYRYPNVLGVLALVALLYVSLYCLKRRRPDLLEKWNVSLEGPIIIGRTDRFNQLLERLGEKCSKLAKPLSLISTAVGIYLMYVGVHFIHSNLLALLSAEPYATPVSVLIPGISIGPESLPYFIAALAIAFLPHELAHGIAASSHGIPIRSSGLLLAVLVLGGFVEPDEEKLERSSLLAKMGVFTAGSFANFLTFLILSTIFLMSMYPSGVLVNETLEGYPASSALERMDLITRLNDTKIESLADLVGFLKRTKPGDVVYVTVERGGRELVMAIRLAEDPRNRSKGFIGAKFSDFYELRGVETLGAALRRALSLEVYKLFLWSTVICQSFAVINMLPIYPFDGGRLLSALVDRVSKRGGLGSKVKIAATVYFAAILLANILLSLKIWGIEVWLP